MPRLFVALDCPTAVRDWAAKVAQTVQRLGFAARWTHPEDFHITLRFLGLCDDRQAAAVVRALAEVRHPPVMCMLGGLGFFPAGDPAQAESLWLAALPVASLRSLKDAIDAVLGPDPQSERGFHPHVTLAQFRRDPGSLLGDALKSADSNTSPAWTAVAATLFARHSAAGPLYRVVQRIPLSH